MNKAVNAITSTMKNWGPSKYAAAGAAAGALYGGIAGEDAASGAIRGAVAGAAIGGVGSLAAQKWGNVKNTYGFHKHSAAVKEQAIGDTIGAAAELFKNPDNPESFFKFGAKLSSSKAVNQVQSISQKNSQALKRLSNQGTAMDRAVYLAGSMGETALDSVSSHLTNPAINTIKSTLKGDFKNISGSGALATAFTGYGVYEAGKIGKDIADGEYGNAASGMMKMAGLKYGFIGAQNAYKGVKAARAAGITGKQVFDFTKRSAANAHKAIMESGGYFSAAKSAGKAGVDTVKDVGEWVQDGTIMGSRI